MLRRGATLVGILSCSGCAAQMAPIGEVAFPNSTSGAAGLGIEIQTHSPFGTSDGFALGVRIDHFVQVNPYVDYDRSRYLFEAGWSSIPRGYRRRFGFEVFGLVGAGRGAMGAEEPTRIAFVGGFVTGVPIRIVEADFGDNGVLRPTIMVVPFLTGTVAYPVANEYQLQLGGGIGIRVHLDSTLLP